MIDPSKKALRLKTYTKPQPISRIILRLQPLNETAQLQERIERLNRLGNEAIQLIDIDGLEQYGFEPIIKAATGGKLQ